MKRTFACFSAALVFFFVLLTFSSPYTSGTALARTDKCDDCVARCGRQEEACYAQHGFD